jgi:hypothetical protein
MRRWRRPVLSLLSLSCLCTPVRGAPCPEQARGATRAFEIRGIKGLWWEGIAKYRQALPWLAAHNLNFLMLCYSSFPASGADWRADYTPTEQTQLRELAAQAVKRGVHLCLSFNPGIWSKPPLLYGSEEDYQAAWRKVRTVHALGIRWFALCLDDIHRGLQPPDQARFGTLQAAQVYLVNRLWTDMKTLQPRPTLIFCPSAYTTEDAQQHPDYIKTIGKGLDPEIRIFWTGPTVCSPSITAEDARRFGAWVRRKPFVWDNYPVNDMFPWRPLLAPVKNRAPDLPDAVSGYLANPMKQWPLSRLPLATLADYLNDPAGYDPTRSMKRALAEFPRDWQPALRLLMELYGSSFLGEKDYPPMPRPTGWQAAKAALSRYYRLRRLLAENPGWRDLWADAQPTLEEDIVLLKTLARKPSPLFVYGSAFTGGGGPVFGFYKLGRPVNYVYARPTGREEMRAEFVLKTVPKAPVELRLTARNDDYNLKPLLRIALNEQTLFEGASPFHSEGFQTKTFAVAASALHPGRNVLTIRNLEEKGTLGMPPWFMVSAAELAVK